MFPKEINESAVLFLMAKISWLKQLGYIDKMQMVLPQDQAQVSSNQKVTTDLKRLREEILVDKIFKQGKSDKSLQTQLVNYLIQMYYPSENAKWREMATTGKFVVGENTIVLNKDQRYKCIHQLAKWGCPYEDLFEAEFARDYSDADERAQISIESIRHREESKEKREIWDSYLVPEKWKKADFDCSAACFLNQYNREEGELYADLWFESVEYVEANFHRDYFLVWFN